MSEIESARNVSFAKDEGVRFEHRDALYPLLETKVSQWNAKELQEALDKVGGCWGEYQSMREAADDSVLVRDNPVFTELKNPSGFSYPTPGSALTIANQQRGTPDLAPKLGEHTQQVLERVLDQSKDQISALKKSGVIEE